MTAPAPPPPPALTSWWFYNSPLPLDDPLSPLPITTSSTSSQRHPPRPFSHFDTGALERAYQEILVSQTPPKEPDTPPPTTYPSRPVSSAGRIGNVPAGGRRRGLIGNITTKTTPTRDKLSSEPLTPTHLRHYRPATEQKEYAEEGRGHESLNAPFSGSYPEPTTEPVVDAGSWITNSAGLVIRGRTLGRSGMKLRPDDNALASTLRQDEQSPPQLNVDNRRRRRSSSPELNPWTGNPISLTRESSSSPTGAASTSVNPITGITSNPFIRSLSNGRKIPSRSPSPAAPTKRQKASSITSDSSTQSSPSSPTSSSAPPPIKQKEIPVGIQRLYKVLLPSLTMTPIYWLPVHDISGVYRATWFYKDTMLPVETDMANRLERGYCEVRAWTEEWDAELESAVEVGREGEEKVRWRLWEVPSGSSVASSRPGTSQGMTEPMDIKGGGSSRFTDGSGGSVPGSKPSTPSNRRSTMFATYSGNQTPLRVGTPPMSQFQTFQPPPSPLTSTMSNVTSVPANPDELPPIQASAAPPIASAAVPNPNDWVIFANDKEAYICRDTMLGFGNKRPLAAIRKGVTSGVGTRVVRGFSVEEWERLHPKNKISGGIAEKKGVGAAVAPGVDGKAQKAEEKAAAENAPQGVSSEEAKKEVDNRQEVSDLFLVIHGIGQKLSERVESFHFTHAINSFRRLLNTELRDPAVAPHLRDSKKGMMVLPINWRSNLSFEDGMPPPVSKNANNNYKNNYSLADITLQTIPAVRNLIGDVMLDIPYYLSHHKKKMIKAVVDEANRVYGLWREYNPGWEERGGRVHLIAHSLGSAIALDVLSKQPTSIIEWRKLKDHKYEKEKSDGAEPKGCYGCTGRGKRDREEKEGKERDQAKKDNHDKSDTELLFDFDTSGLFCVGSPAGFFLLLNRSMLIPRRGRRKPGYTKPEVEDPGVTGEAGTYGCLAVDNIYNVMNYSDPIAYRLNPTIDTAYAESIKVNAIPSATSTLFESLSSTFRSVLPRPRSTSPTQLSSSSVPAKIQRLPSNIELETHDFSREEIVEKRMYLLNDNGTIDWFTGSLGALLENQYINMLGAHSSYWESRDYARFLVMEAGRKPGRENVVQGIRAVKKGRGE